MNEEMNGIPEEFYFHGEEINQFIHIQVPIALIKEKVFRGISDSAKILYGLLLNRTGLSIRNEWTDENDRTYIIYTIESLMEDLGVGRTKAKSMFAELSNINDTGIGLIKKVRVLNKPSRIYVLNFMQVLEFLQGMEVGKSTLQIVENNEETTSETAEILVGREYGPRAVADTAHGQSELRPTDGRRYGPQSVADTAHGETQVRPTDSREQSPRTAADTAPNNIDINNNDIIDKDTVIKSDIYINPINPIRGEDMKPDKTEEMDRVKEMIKKNIKYDFLSNYPEKWDIDSLDFILNIMSEEYVCGGDLSLGGRSISHELMKSTIENYNMLTMKYVLESLDGNTTSIKNTRKYLLAVIYNAPLTQGLNSKLKLQHEVMKCFG